MRLPVPVKGAPERLSALTASVLPAPLTVHVLPAFESGELGSAVVVATVPSWEASRPPRAMLPELATAPTWAPVGGISRVGPCLAQRPGLDEDVGGWPRHCPGPAFPLASVSVPVRLLALSPTRKVPVVVSTQAARSADGSGPGGVGPAAVSQLDGRVLGDAYAARAGVGSRQHQLVAALDVEFGRVDDVARIEQVLARTAVVDPEGARPAQRGGLDRSPLASVVAAVPRAKGQDAGSLAGVQRAFIAGQITREDHSECRIGSGGQAQVGSRFTRQGSGE